MRRMRILRVLRSRTLACGCLTGVYEAYDGRVAEILDARGEECADARHAPGRLVFSTRSGSPRPFGSDSAGDAALTA
jgi:hypothetical protein